jgi:hypothetical protein
MDTHLEPDEAEIVKIMSKLPEFSHLSKADSAKIRHEIGTAVANALREYYFENTRMTCTKWSVKLREADITDDD